MAGGSGLQPQLLDIAQEAVLALDVRERVRYWNPGAERLFGWSADEVLGKPLDELWPAADEMARANRQERLGVLRRRETLNGEACLRSKSGDTVAVEYNARAFFNDEGKLQGYVSVYRDVTERRRSERALRESEARLRALVQASPLGIDVMDVDGNPIYYNPKCEELHGIRLGDAAGKGWENAVHPEDRERVGASWYAAASKGDTWSEVYRFRHADGKVVWVSGRAAPMHVDGELVGYVGTLEDITAEREARERAERATQIRDELLAVVAHDLRSPLNTIGLTARGLLAGSSGEQAHLLEIIQRSAATMEHLISDLLDLSLRSGRFSIQRARIDLDALCHETMELFDAEAESRGIELFCRLDADLPAIRGDSKRLAQLLSNLIGNALKFTRAPGKVTLRAVRCEDGVQLSIEDDGPGIPHDHLPHLFEPHWEGGGDSGSGMGLGLSIARSIVGAHDGRIWADSVPGQGTTVHFVLPSSV